MTKSRGIHTKRGEQDQWVREFALTTTDRQNCLIWPYRRDRYGYARMGHGAIVSRVVCIEAHGNPPEANFEAAHSCGKGHLGCVNPLHLSWKTHSANQMDRLDHGTDHRGSKHGMAKLTEDRVLAIWKLKGVKSQQVIADEMGVSRQQISRIHLGKDWGWLTSGQRVWVRQSEAA